MSEYVRGIALLNPDLGDDFGDDYGSIGARFDTLRLVGQFKADALQIGVLLQTAENSNDDELGGNSLEQDAYVLSAGFAVGANLFKAQYSSSTTDISGNVDGEIEATAIGFGVDHSLTKQTTLFAYYNMLSYEYDTNPTVETTKDNLGVGIIHNF
ncbi:MAG: porin [Gammaproteobacteria bacterium]